MKWFSTLLIFFFLFWGSVCFATEQAEHDRFPIVKTLTLPKSPNKYTPTNHYLETLLKAIYAVQGYTLEISYSEVPINQERATKALTKGEQIDLTWLPTTKAREKALFAIKVPLYKGLHGNRILLINKDRQAVFNEVKDLQDLTSLVGLQHKSWSDYHVLKENGLKVNGTLNVSSMIKALKDQLGDYFPRSALTVYAEHKRHQDKGIAIEENLVLRYPSYYYFFINKQDKELQHILTEGFTSIIEDGKFDQIFRRFNGKKIKDLQLDKRRAIDLRNSDVPDASFNY